MRWTVLAAALLASGACSHASPPPEAAKAEQRDDWLLALRSDLERIGANDGFQGRVRVLHGGKPEIDRAFLASAGRSWGKPGIIPSYLKA